MRRSILLIAPDEATARRLMGALAAADLEPSLARSGEAGWELFDPGRFDAVVLDLDLPDRDGFVLLTDLVSGASSLPMLVLSALDDERSKVLAFELGATDYLTKPFDVAELVARVRRRLPAASPAGERRHGRWELQPERRVVLDGTRAVALSALEWRVLDHLIARAGETCTRDELVEQAWGGADGLRANVVDVCVRRLRRKLGRDAVTTVRGRGYRVG
jgi:DNA-binding response OmpR family regulator